MSGYELRTRMNGLFGAVSSEVNPGQVYATLQRLERDGLIVGTEVSDDARNKRTYELTDLGHRDLQAWIETPLPPVRPRDELFVKLILLRQRSREDLRRLAEAQRQEFLQSIRDLEELARTKGGDLVAALAIEGAQIHAAADMAWLEVCLRRLLEEDTRNE